MKYRRAFYSKYAMVAGGDKKLSPVKASVDITRFTNATRAETVNESKMRDIANDYWEQSFSGVRMWEPKHEGFELDADEKANMRLNAIVRVYVYTVDEIGELNIIVDKVIKW